MKMKKSFRITLLAAAGVLASSTLAYAILLRIPDIPTPSISLPKALEIATKEFSSEEGCLLIAVDWCQASKFQPRVSHGAQYDPAGDDPEGYSWFFTYVYTNKALAEQLAKSESALYSPPPKYNSVLVIRIKDNGTRGTFVGFST